MGASARRPSLPSRQSSPQVRAGLLEIMAQTGAYCAVDGDLEADLTDALPAGTFAPTKRYSYCDSCDGIEVSVFTKLDHRSHGVVGFVRNVGIGFREVAFDHFLGS